MPRAAPGETTWLQHALSNFGKLQMEAGSVHARLQCMPVVIATSTKASAVVPARDGSRVRDLQLRPLTEQEDITGIVQDLLERMGKLSGPSAGLPEQVLMLLRLLGGNPRLLAWALTALSGRNQLAAEEFVVAGAPNLLS